MLVGQQLGPFLIEKELGTGAMGAVYRGKYVKTGQAVAVKIMAPGLGTGSDSAAARFEREAKILKQLSHPNIVKLFGIGKHQGTAYYAMEFVQGESLDKVMARRDRMSWEEVVDLGQQLCAALQHAHEKGIVHRDLKPSNLMILPDGTLKLTDFGIAKDLDVTQLTGANCTIGTAAYMSPEQCRGDKDINYKSDLYSLGIVFYELITGRKPFISDSAMDLFMMHVKGDFVRPSRIVLDLPVWMDTLICQLLEKATEKRPLDAAMVSQVLGSIQEKVEAQQSAGLDAARSRRIDGKHGQRNPDEEDREAARTLLGKRKKRKKKSRRFPVWLQATGLLLMLGIVITLLVIALQPASPEKLYKQAEKMMASSNTEMHDRAREGPIAEYLRRYGKLANAQTEQVRKWADDYDVAQLEGVIRKYIRYKKGEAPIPISGKSAEEDLALDASLAEYDGNIDSARESWAKLKASEAGAVSVLADRRLAMIDQIASVEKKLLEIRAKAIDDHVEPKDFDDLQRQAFLALRQERLGDRLGLEKKKVGDHEGARQRYDSLKEAADKDASQHFWMVYAAYKSKQMKNNLKADREAAEPNPPLERVKYIVAEARKRYRPGATYRDVRGVAHDIVVLYGQDTAMEEPVKEAKALVESIDKELGPPKGH